jgi:outer membrane protein TolC
MSSIPTPTGFEGASAVSRLPVRGLRERLRCPLLVASPILPVSLPAELAHDRPDILEAQAELHAASAAIGVATANLYPHLTISAAAAIPGSLVLAGGTLWSAASGLTGPLFHGGAPIRAADEG